MSIVPYPPLGPAFPLITARESNLKNANDEPARNAAAGAPEGSAGEVERAKRVAALDQPASAIPVSTRTLAETAVKSTPNDPRLPIEDRLRSFLDPTAPKPPVPDSATAMIEALLASERPSPEPNAAQSDERKAETDAGAGAESSAASKGFDASRAILGERA